MKVKLANVNENLINKLDKLINQNFGKSSVEFYVEDEEQHQNVKLFSKKSKIEINDTFLLEMDKLVEVNYELS